MKRNKTKFLALGLAAVLSVGVAAGCGNGNIGKDEDSSKITQISFRQWGGTASSTDWLQQAADRFAAEKANEPYESGKKGVRVEISTNKDSDYTSSIPDYDILMDENEANIYDMQTRGYLADIDDLVKGLQSKIEPQLLPKFKGADGKYYGLPHYSYDVSISYNVDLFKTENLYIAAPGEESVVNYKSSLLPASSAGVNFVFNENTKKSCGPNGIPNDYDDGLPSSLEEFIVLCDYIKNKKQINPFAISDITGGANYAFMLIESLWAGMVGTDAMKATTCNFTDAEVEVVKEGALSYDGTLLNTGIKMPQTETVVLSDDNGYRMYDMSARYYALSFLELAKNKGWFKNQQMTNTKAQEFFVLGNYNANDNDRCAMLVDSTFWYGEAVSGGTLTKYKSLSGGKEANVSMMPMPVQLTGQVTEGNGKKPTVIDTSATVFVNKRVEKNEGLFRAVKEFIEFLYSDAELKAFTETSKLTMNLKYDYDKSSLGNFYAGVLEIEKAAGDKVYAASDNIKFSKNRSSFSLIWGGKLNYFGSYHNGSYAALMGGETAASIFTQTRRAKVADWESLG
ncbi:extracellular solute-binding protein family 1 [Acidiphilium sp. CAG:727]|nr:extracellular solute-binding protein family 1 [Acidiphilium sp. CAG:727]